MSNRCTITTINRITRLAVDRSLSEVLAGVAILFLWIALVGLVLWLTAEKAEIGTVFYAKGTLLVAMLLGSISGLLAVYVWSVERYTLRGNATGRKREW